MALNHSARGGIGVDRAARQHILIINMQSIKGFRLRSASNSNEDPVSCENAL